MSINFLHFAVLLFVIATVLLVGGVAGDGAGTGRAAAWADVPTLEGGYVTSEAERGDDALAGARCRWR